ncbi:hypothetical protein M413DRAFT_145558 [Hebeloma cylindrosporum]|uniref:Nephrocystin 3-like N-terminal domain-containing protein n=1 Tax=Hebeloma cylindrosporum TaxID=76867 RepID=A0A0C3CCE0_HEBCY|nr:hypothetical protein M413DRAFT_145558 [Hebeloma cylindrosporum h7]
MFNGAINTTIYGGTFTVASNFENDLLEKYVVPGAFHDSAERYDPPKCHPHTREAVLKRIMLWVDDAANEAQIMWMFGPAGAGKSAIAQSIAEMCFQQGKLAASFFFSRNASGRDNETRFISTLVYQLALSIPEIQGAVNQALEDDRLLFSRSLHVQAENLIRKPLNDLLLNSTSENGFQSPQPRLIIVDGLDECGQARNQRYVLDVLATVTKDLTYPLLFFVASRPEQVIRDSFSKESICSITSRLALDDTYRPNADIERFLRSKFREIVITHPSGADIPSGWPSDKDIRRLVEKSSGQFIYASTVVKFVESTSHLPLERLEVIFGLVAPEIATPFAELDALYNQILTNVIQIERGLDILMALMLFRQLPPRPDTLDCFFSYKPGLARAILSDLHSILYLPPKQDRKGEIKILHASLSDFLLDATRSGRFFIDLAKSRTTIARKIIGILMEPVIPRELEIACYTALPVVCVRTKSVDVLKDIYEFDLLRYVSWYRPRHLHPINVENNATFFNWMKLKFHPDYGLDLFHHHILAIDRWIYQEALWHVPQVTVDRVDSKSINFFTFRTARDTHDWVLPDSDTVMFTIVQRFHHVAESDLQDEEQTHLAHWSYILYLGPPLTGVLMLDRLLLEVLRDPSRNAIYRLDVEICALIAQSLWLSVLPWKNSRQMNPKLQNRCRFPELNIWD